MAGRPGAFCQEQTGHHCSRFDPDPPRALVVYVPLTTQYRSSHYEVELPQLAFLDRKSVANVQGLGSLPIVRLERKLGILPSLVMEKLKETLFFVFDLLKPD